jgi:hypothetical protein
LGELGVIDVFIHDSLYCQEHVKLEFEMAYPYLKPAGVLIADDAGWNTAAVRKYMGNNLALFFGKDILLLFVYASLYRDIRRGRAKAFPPPFLLDLAAMLRDAIQRKQTTASAARTQQT